MLGADSSSQNARVLLCVIGDDIHSVANRLIEWGLREYGFDVWNLGVSCKPRVLVDACLEFTPNIVLIGSLNGEASDWAGDFMCLANSYSLQHIHFYLGGNLEINNFDREAVEARFIDIGFSRAFHLAPSFDSLFTSIFEDLSLDAR